MDNEQEIRRTIGEFMGYEGCFERGGELFGYYRNRNGELVGSVELPFYTHDLNAMHEVEAELERRGLALKYMHALTRVIEYRIWSRIHSTAAQRAQAAYQVIKGVKP